MTKEIGPGGPNAIRTTRALFRYQYTIAYLRAGIAEYEAAIVFLPGLRDPATGSPCEYVDHEESPHDLSS